MNTDFNDDQIKRAIHSHEKSKMADLLARNNIKRPTPQKQFKFSIKQIIAAAAVFISFGVLGWLLIPQNNSTQMLANSFLVEVPGNYNLTTRSSKDSENECILLYQQKAWSQAIACFKNEGGNPFYIGVSLMQQNDYEQAAANFEQVLAGTQDSLQLDAHWLLALCYIKLDKSETAKTHLQVVAAQKQWATSKDAAKLLKNF